MKTIRIGNDLPIAWTVLRCGAKEDFYGKSLKLSLTNRYGEIPVKKFSVKENVIEFIFHGSEQRDLGEYGLLLVENDDVVGMYTVDVSRAFSLVPSNAPLCQCISEVHLTSDIAIPVNGLSAYELAVKHGYEGTEEEWVDHLNLPLQTGSGSNSIMHINAAEASGSNSFAEGTGTTAAGSGSHAEGKESQTGVAAHHAHSEGLRTQATQQQAHAEGSDTVASGAQSHAEGSGTQASGTRSHAEGSGTHAAGSSSHAEGHECVAEGAQSHAEGYRSKAVVTIAHAEGSETEATGGASHAEGSKSIAAGAGSHAEGVSTSAAGYSSHAEGQFTRTKNRAEHAEGYYNLSVQGKTVHSVGIGNGDSEDPAQGKHRKNAEEIHTDGRKFIIGIGGYDGTNSTDENTKSVQEVMDDLDVNLKKGTGESSVRQTTAKGAGGVGSVALGENTEASGPYSFSEGRGTTAQGAYSHAEGTETTAGGTRSHAEGMSSKATGDGSHAEGYATIAEGAYSHTEGSCTKTLNGTEHAQGKYNLPKRGKTIHTIGIGSGDNDRKNAEEVHTDGRKFLLGVGGYDGTNSETAKAVQEVLANLVDLDSEQTISGAKTFITALIAKAGLNMVNTRIRKVGTPKDADDAATKAYVDALIQRLEAAEAKITTLQNKLNEITTEE